MADIGLEQFVRELPKAELHMHVEGSLEPELLFTLAERNGVELEHDDVESLRSAYSFTDLQSFLDIYYRGASVLVTEQDFYDLAVAYFERAAADGVRRSEIFFDPQTHTERGIPFGVFMPGLIAAIGHAERALNVSADLIMCFLRHLPQSDAIETFHEASPYLEHIIGVGLDSSEVGNPPENFANVFEFARRSGLRCVAHAGEEGPPAYIAGALDSLGAERIDHGVRAEEDPDLVERLARDRVPLTVCPLSNVALNVVDRMEDHNLERLLRSGLIVTVNSDDPAYFGGYVVENYVAAAEALDLDRDDLITMARNSLEASFASDDDKQRWLAELADFVSVQDQ